jgi:hypothetical protein
LKEFLINITNQVNTIAASYTDNLEHLSRLNKTLKEQAKDFYEKYKITKKEFTKDRQELKEKMKQLESEKKTSQEDSKKINTLLDQTKTELELFKRKAGLDREQDEDVLIMQDIIKSVRNQTDIYAGLNNDEINLLNELFEKDSKAVTDSEGTFKENKNILIEDGEEYEDEDYESENCDNFEYVNGDEIIKHIEDIVNDLFGNKKISKIHIDQINDSLYKFNGISALLYINENVLKGSFKFILVKEKDKETTFHDWVLSKFAVSNNIVVKKVPSKICNFILVTSRNEASLIEKKLVDKKLLSTSLNDSTRGKQKK